METTAVRSVRWIFAILSAIFVICILIQVFIAGLGVFGEEDWEMHITFVHFFELIPVIMFILAFFGRIKGIPRWYSLGLFLLIMVQYATANVPNAGYLAALHPVVALLMFWGAVTVFRHSRRLLVK